MTNVLILSAAAKVLLVRAFAEAARAGGGRVIAADLTTDNAALFEADRAILLPRADAPEFGAALADACEAHAIDLIVPTRDGELPILAAMKERRGDRGVTVLAPGSVALETCQDKRRFVAFCAANGFATPGTYAAGEIPARFPVFVRPERGAGGQGARLVETAAQLGELAGQLVQALETVAEYTVDVLMDLKGAPLQAVARQRLQVRAGEAVKSRTVALPDLTEPALGLCTALGLVGHNVVQAFYAPGAPPRFIEVNPRFGGASNLSIAAGLASPERLLQMVEGREREAAEPRALSIGLTMLRYAEDRIVTDDQLARLTAR